jgi:OmpA-OmpF porin, OOP family
VPHSAPVQLPWIASSKPIVVSTAVAPAPAQLSGPAVNLRVNCARGSAELIPDAMLTLDDLGKALSNQDLAAYKFRI